MKHPERPSNAKNNRAPALEITNKKLTKTNMFLTLEQENIELKAMESKDN